MEQTDLTTVAVKIKSLVRNAKEDYKVFGGDFRLVGEIREELEKLEQQIRGEYGTD